MSPKRPPTSSSLKGPSISPAELEILRLFVKSSLGDSGGQITEASVGRVQADFLHGTMMCDGKPVPTSAKELHLLHYLVVRRGELISRDDIFRDVWKYNTPPVSRSIDNYILSLRKKIEPDPAAPKHLHTMRGAGYKLTF